MSNKQAHRNNHRIVLIPRAPRKPRWLQTKMKADLSRVVFAAVCLAISGCMGKVPEEIYMEGRKAFEAADYEEAERSLTEFVSKYPSHDYVPPAYYFVGVARDRLGDSTGAIEAFLEAEKWAREPQVRLYAQIGLAALYRQAGQWEDSLHRLRALVKSTSGDDRKNFAIEVAQTLQLSGRIEEASAYLWERATTTDEPRFRGDYLLSLADMYWATDTVKPMLRVLSEIIEDASIPQDLRVDAFYWRGRAFEQLDRFDDAIQNFKDLQETFPGTIDAIEASVALAVLCQEEKPALSEAYLREATEQFARRIAEATESADTRTALRARIAEAYFRVERYEEAIATYEQIQLLNPDNDQVQQFVDQRIQQIRDVYAQESKIKKGILEQPG